MPLTLALGMDRELSLAFFILIVVALLGLFAASSGLIPAVPLEHWVGWYFVALIGVAALISPRLGILALLLIPSLLGREAVKTKLFLPGLESVPLYTFDVLLVGFFVFIALNGLWRSFRSNEWKVEEFPGWPLLLLISVFLAWKFLSDLLAGHLSVVTLRNSAMFYYPPLVLYVVAFYLRNHGGIRDFSTVAMSGYGVFVPVAIIFTISLLLGEPGRLFRYNEYGGLIIPIEPLHVLAPPALHGNLILLAMLVSALLFQRGVRFYWKLLLISFLVFDAVLYLNRALWLAIAAGLVAGVVLNVSRRNALVLGISLVAAMGIAIVTPVIRDYLAQQHSGTSEWRLAVWSLTFDEIMDAPLFGHSLGRYVVDQKMEQKLARKFGSPPALRRQASRQQAERGNVESVRPPPTRVRHPRYPHNSYLSLLYYGGLLVGGTIILFILWVLWRLYQRYWSNNSDADRAVTAAFFRAISAGCVYNLFNVVLETPTEAWTFWVAVALGWWHGRYPALGCAGSAKGDS